MTKREWLDNGIFEDDHEIDGELLDAMCDPDALYAGGERRSAVDELFAQRARLRERQEMPLYERFVEEWPETKRALRNALWWRVVGNARARVLDAIVGGDRSMTVVRSEAAVQIVDEPKMTGDWWLEEHTERVVGVAEALVRRVRGVLVRFVGDVAAHAQGKGGAAPKAEAVWHIDTSAPSDGLPGVGFDTDAISDEDIDEILFRASRLRSCHPAEQRSWLYVAPQSDEYNVVQEKSWIREMPEHDVVRMTRGAEYMALLYRECSSRQRWVGNFGRDYYVPMDRFEARVRSMSHELARRFGYEEVWFVVNYDRSREPLRPLVVAKPTVVATADSSDVVAADPTNDALPEGTPDE